MTTKFPRVFFIFNCFLYFCHGSLYQGIIDPILTGYIFDVDITDVFDGLSIIDCFRKCCTKVAECQSFGHNEYVLQCRLYNTSSFNLLQGVYKGSWKIFKRQTTECPFKLGYLHEVKLKICYKYYHEGTAPNIQTAAVVCSNDGGHLLRITSSAIMTHIKFYLEKISAKGTTYIDGHRQDEFSTNWYFSNGELMIHYNWSPFVLFNNTHRNNIKITKDGDTWLTTGGESDRPFLCQVDLNS